MKPDLLYNICENKENQRPKVRIFGLGHFYVSIVARRLLACTACLVLFAGLHRGYVCRQGPCCTKIWNLHLSSESILLVVRNVNKMMMMSLNIPNNFGRGNTKVWRSISVDVRTSISYSSCSIKTDMKFWSELQSLSIYILKRPASNSFLDDDCIQNHKKAGTRK